MDNNNNDSNANSMNPAGNMSPNNTNTQTELSSSPNNMNGTPMNNISNQNVPPMGMASNTVNSGMAPTKPKSNGKMIAIIAAVIVVLIAVIVTLVIVLMNNNSSKSQANNKGNSHYEEDGNKGKDDDKGDTNNITASVSCMGYSFDMEKGYDYDCQGDGLTVQSQDFAMYLELSSGMSYYQAEGNSELLASSLEDSAGVVVKSHRQYTASTGRKMLVFDTTYNGVNMYIFITSATSSSVIVGELTNSSARPTTADLETATSLLDSSTIASKLPDGEVDENDDLPVINWDQYLKVPELAE